VLPDTVERYSWFESAVGFWEEFNGEQHRAHYRVYAAVDGAANRSARNRLESASSNMKEVE
jgi:hypothetical protein